MSNSIYGKKRIGSIVMLLLFFIAVIGVLLADEYTSFMGARCLNGGILNKLCEGRNRIPYCGEQIITMDGTALPWDGERLLIAQGEDFGGSIKGKGWDFLCFEDDEYLRDFDRSVMEGHTFSLYVFSTKGYRVCPVVFTTLPVLSLTSHKKSAAAVLDASPFNIQEADTYVQADMSYRDYKKPLNHGTCLSDIIKVKRKNRTYTLKADNELSMLSKKTDTYKLTPIRDDDTCFRAALGYETFNEINTEDKYDIPYSFCEVIINNTYKGLYLLTPSLNEGYLKADEIKESYSDTAENAGEYRKFIETAFALDNISSNCIDFYRDGKEILLPERIDFAYGILPSDTDYLTYDYINNRAYDKGKSELYGDVQRILDYAEKLHGVILASGVLQRKYEKFNFDRGDEIDRDDNGYPVFKSSVNDDFEWAYNDLKDKIRKRQESEGIFTGDITGTFNNRLTKPEISGNSSGLYTFWIDTMNGTLDYVDEWIQNKEPGRVKIFSPSGNLVFDEMTPDIHFRGHSSGVPDKKCYRITFDEEKELPFLGKQSTIITQANALDASRIRNFLSYKLAKACKVPSAIDCNYAEFYYNGEFWGNYLVLQDAKKTAAKNISEGGYLLETTNREYRLAFGDTAVRDGSSIIYKVDYPKLTSESERLKIEGEVTEIDELIQNCTDDAVYDKLLKRLDIDSFALLYIMDRLCNDMDSGDYSTFYYKDSEDGKLYAGPFWDFDKAYGNRKGLNECPSYDTYKVRWPSLLFENPRFQECVKRQYENIVKPELSLLKNDVMPQTALLLKESFERDLQRWETKSRTIIDKGSLNDNYNYVIEYLNNRQELLEDILYRRDSLVRVYVQDERGRCLWVKKRNKLHGDILSYVESAEKADGFMDLSGNRITTDTVFEKDLVMVKLTESD